MVLRQEAAKTLRSAPAESEIKDLIDQRRWGTLRRALAPLPVPELADLIQDLDRRDRALVFRLLPRRLSAEVFSELEPDLQTALLRDLTDAETRGVLADMSPDDRTQLLEELPGQATQRLLNLLSPEDLREARQLLGYPEDSAGRLMTPDYVAVRPHWTVQRGLEHIREKGSDNETTNVIYVTDESWRLIDALELRKFILGEPSRTVESIMDRTFVSISAFDDREEAVRVIQRYDLDALPVVDSEGVLLGVVTVDDVLDVAQEEATEDFHKVGAVAPLGVSYRGSGVWALFRKRIGWLLGLVLLNLASSGIIAAYEETLAASIALAFFIPLLIDSGGNTGAQSATLMIRALATGDIDMDQWLGTILKELSVGVSLGVTLGLAGWALGFLRGDFQIGVVVGLAMASTVIVTNMVGTLLPFLLIRLRLDPAVASSPLITSIADAVGLLVYFTIATWVLATAGAV